MSDPTILFTRKDDWQRQIANAARHFTPVFHDLHEVAVDEYPIIVPLTLHAQHKINSQMPHLLGRKTLSPSDQAIAICKDKRVFAEFMEHQGLGRHIPRTGTGTYPYVIKKRIGAWGIGARIITDAGMAADAGQMLGSSEYFAQRYVVGTDEYASHIIFHDNDIQFCATRKFTFDSPLFIKGRDAAPRRAETVDHSHLLPLFTRILRKIEYAGICCIDYALVGDELQIYEINPRYGASMTHFINEAMLIYTGILNSGSNDQWMKTRSI